MILLPTRGRPGNVKRLLDAAGGVTLPVVLLCDADDVELEEYRKLVRDGVSLYIGDKSNGIVSLLNEWYEKEGRGCRWFGLLADDVVPATEGWDVRLRDKCLESVISWGDDRQHGAMLATHCFIRGDVIKYFGWLAYPRLYHGYADLLWTVAAYMMNAGAGYCKDVVLEHRCVVQKQFDKEKDKKEYVGVLPSFVDAVKQFQIAIYNLEQKSEEQMKEDAKYDVRAVLKEWDPKKVLIAIASGGSSSDTFNIYLQNTWAKSGFPNIIYEQSPYIHWNRESCAEYAIREGFEYLMFFDNDMVFPIDIIHRLFAWDKDVVTTNYTTKERPARFMCIGLDGKTCVTGDDSDGLEQVWMAPTGTMLIKTEVFKKMEQPWFDTSRTHKLGEDYFFTHKCKGAGVEVYCDHTLTKEVGHEGRYIYTWKDAFATDNFCNDKYPGGIAKKVVEKMGDVVEVVKESSE